MVKVMIKASVEVTGGQTALYSSEIDPATSAYSTVEVGKDEVTVQLLPAESTPMLLAISAKYADGRPADIKVTPTGDADSKGAPFKVSGSLLVANWSLLNNLVDDGPKGLKLQLWVDPPQNASSSNTQASTATQKAAKGNVPPEKKATVEIIAASSPNSGTATTGTGTRGTGTAGTTGTGTTSAAVGQGG